MSEEIFNTVKSWIADNRPSLIGANIHLDTQDGARDMHFAKSPLLPDIGPEHINSDQYHVATVTNKLTMDDGTVIPQVVKLTVRDNTVQKVLESK